MNVQFACRCKFGRPHQHTNSYSCEELTDKLGEKYREDHVIPVVQVQYLAHGDYLGGSVERSNFKSWVEDHEWFEGKAWARIFGGYGYQAIIVRKALYDAFENKALREKLTDCEPTWMFMIEALDGLDSYPLLDEDHLSNMEMEESWEAWKDYAARDFVGEVVKSLSDEDLDELAYEQCRIDGVASALWALYEKHGGMSSESPYCEGGDSYVFPKLKETAQKVTVEEYQAVLKLAKESK